LSGAIEDLQALEVSFSSSLPRWGVGAGGGVVAATTAAGGGGGNVVIHGLIQRIVSAEGTLASAVQELKAHQNTAIWQEAALKDLEGGSQ